MTSFLRQLLSATVVASMLVASPASAAGPSPRLRSVLDGLVKNDHFSRFTVRRVSANEADQRIAEAAKSKVKRTGAMVLETFLFILTIAVIDVTAREIKKEGLKTLSPDRLSAIALKSAHSIVDMPEVYTGLVGATATMMAAKVPLATVEGLLNSPGIKKAFVPVLARAATATIGLMGWEFGAQLWTESASLLNERDYEIAKSFLGISGGVVKVLVAAGSPTDRERARVAKLMAGNMVRVLFLNAELRSTWMKNTWRLHVLTGDFAALLAAMIAAGEVGAKYGRLRGFLAGVVLGAATLAIPRGPKDAVTGFFQSARSRIDDAKLRENTETLSTLTGDPARYRTILKNRRLHRQAIATVAWERIHRTVATKEATAMTAEFDSMFAMYSAEISALGTLKSRAPAPLHAALNSEIAVATTLAEFYGLLIEGGSSLARDHDFKQITDATNARGFDEASVIAQMVAE